MREKPEFMVIFTGCEIHTFFTLALNFTNHEFTLVNFTRCEIHHEFTPLVKFTNVNSQLGVNSHYVNVVKFTVNSPVTQTPHVSHMSKLHTCKLYFEFRPLIITLVQRYKHRPLNPFPSGAVEAPECPW